MKLMLPPQENQQFGMSAEASAQNSYLSWASISRTMARLLRDPMAPRKVEGQQSVTTTAGTWNCFRISYKSKITVKTGPFGFPVNIEGVEWYAPGFGIVKSQSKYGSTAITSIK